ncbi:hypothetical protein VHEMI02609 [[Torrubiella] hemipterigena]|uniref:Uncharacterized protein n=1 Tax=[Torrubiella] hemipterigena TaxID=1531966 RepID=A0A0A1T8P0_9HYPO|nr:hypothetical protein VHEMI02609 [[Torrubiella] hemipterigena]
MRFSVIAVTALAAAVSAEQDVRIKSTKASSLEEPTGSAANSTAPASSSAHHHSSSAAHSHHPSSVAHVHYSSSTPTPTSTSTPCTTKTPTSTPCTSKVKPTTVKHTPKPSVACTKTNNGTHHACPPKPQQPMLAYNGTKPTQVPAVVPSAGAAADNVVPAAAGLGLVAAIGFVLL